MINKLLSLSFETCVAIFYNFLVDIEKGINFYVMINTKYYLIIYNNIVMLLCFKRSISKFKQCRKKYDNNK